MLKNILIGLLGAVVVIAIGASAYTAFASPGADATPAVSPGAGSGTSASNGNGNGQGGNGNGNGGQGRGNSAQSAVNGTPQVQAQANAAGATTVHGTVVSYDLTGLSITTDDGQALYIQLGNSRYGQSIGFAPQIGEGVTVNGFVGDQGLYSAITVTSDSTGQTYSFRDENGRPLWAGGKGNGRGNGSAGGQGGNP